MTALSPDVATRVSTEAAQRLVEAYYPALELHRHSISSFYVPSTIMPDGKSLPVIIFNGNVISDSAEMQAMFQNQMPPARYEVQSFNCHVINPNFIAENAKGATSTSGKNMTILVVVSGYVKYGDSRDATMRGFSENFVLVPNPNAGKSKGHTKNQKEWLIQNQTFRLVV